MKHTGAIQFWKSNAVVNIHHNKKMPSAHNTNNWAGWSGFTFFQMH